MKKLLTFLVVIVMMATAVKAQESTVMFIDQDGYAVEYSIATLADVIATSDTLVEDWWLMEEYEAAFPPTRGPHEPAVLILLPDHTDIIALFIQTNRRDRILSFRMLTNHGWLEADKSCLTSLHFH